MNHRPSSAAIAVIGLACQYPDASTPRLLWENVLAKRRQFRQFPQCRLSMADYYDPDRKTADKTYGRQAAVIDGFVFDWSGRRIPESTMKTTDVVHWLALETSLAAVSDAGYTRDTLPGQRTGVIVGNTLTGEQTRSNTMRLRWPFVRRALFSAARAQGMDETQLRGLTRLLKERYTAVFPKVDEDTLAGGLSNTIAGRICNHLNLMGGGFTVDGACSSSLLAVAHAASRLADGDLDLALVGGVDISLDPFEMVGFAKTGALTDGDMNVYDRGGKGFIPGEGCGFMVLKPLDAARKEGNRVYAVIHGWGISSDGAGTGITAPRSAGQALALERAYHHAPYGIHELDFIEGHGTGTTVGDRTELEAIAQVTGRTPVPKGLLRPCGITSLKSIIGHAKAASGIGGLMKAVMAVNRRVVPPTAACNHPHQAFDNAARRIYPVRLGRLESTDTQLKAGVSSMGFGGINCHITLVSGDAPDNRLQPALEEEILLAHAQEDELFAIGADDVANMIEKIDKLIRDAEGSSIAELADLSARQCPQADPSSNLRAAVVAGHPDDLADRLAQLKTAVQKSVMEAEGQRVISPGPDIWLGSGNTAPRIGFLFPGQGSQRINMAFALVRRFEWARSWMKTADRVTGEQIGVSIGALIHRDMDRASDAEQQEHWFRTLSLTEHAQPAICLTSMLWFEYLTRLGVVPVAVGGHSLGELTACFAAGVMDGATLLEFSTRRGKVMSAPVTTPGGMVSLRCDESTALALVAQSGSTVTVANRNSPHQTVLSGESSAVAQMARLARENGVSAVTLPVSAAFHSPLCEESARQVADFQMLTESMAAPVCTLFTSIDGSRLEAGLSLKDHFSRQIRSRVDFIAMVRSMHAACDVIVEVGPGRVLTGLVRDIRGDGKTPCLPVETAAGSFSDLNRAVGALFSHGTSIRWETFFENRLIRPFTPAGEKIFVVNPCENIPVIEKEKEDEAGIIPGGIHPVLAEAFTGVPDALVSRYLASRGAFLRQVVKADLSFWDPDARPKDVDGAASTPAVEPVAAQAILLDLVSAVTGFPADSLSRNVRLLDDLNLDSIKAGDLITRFAKQCGISFPDPTLLANAALGELADAAQRLRGSAETKKGRSTVDRAKLERLLVQQVAEVTGFPAESIELSFRLLDDLNLDSIKAGDLIVWLANKTGVSDRLEVPGLANASLAQVVDQIAMAMEPEIQVAPPLDAMTELRVQAARITGFPMDTLDPDLLVEKDLHLGPDKLQDLVVSTATALGLSAHLDIEPLRTCSLREIGTILNRMAAQQQEAVAGVEETRPPVVPDDHTTWVRNFAMEMVETPYPLFPENWRMRSENDLQKARFLILFSEDAADVAEALDVNLFHRGAFTKRCAMDHEDVDALVQDPAFSHLVTILPKNDLGGADPSAMLDRMIRMRSLLTRVPPAAEAPRRTTTIAWIQFGGGFFGRNPRFATADRCATMALGASLHLERGDLRVRVVDFSSALSPEIIAWETLAEIFTQESYAAVGYDLDQTRRIPIPHLVQPADAKVRDIRWTGKDVILVTGGAKGITAACALAVARHTGVTMALVGRTSFPEEAPDEPASREIRDVLDQYVDLGLTAAYFSCDVTNRSQVENMLRQVTEKFGTVTGIIHGAGLNRPRLTGQVVPEQAFAETAPKVLGLLHLLDPLHGNPPKLIVGLGSIIGLTGMPGNGWYGFSNEVMDILLRGFHAVHPQTQILNVAYSIWRDEGMGARMGSVALLRDRGIDAIPTDMGVDRFLRLFTHDPGHRQVVVTARLGGLDTWRQTIPDPPRAWRFLERLIHLTPGVEAVFSAHLSLESDLYLKDHHFQGSYLFPTVFGLEAMAEAVFYLTEQKKPVRMQIRDIRLLRPITVDAESGADITIHAIISEADGDGRTTIHAGIVKQDTGVASDFFSASFAFEAGETAPAAVMELPDEPLPLVPETDLYRPTLLFQGPRFQGIERVWQIQQSGERTGTALLTSRLTPKDRLVGQAFGKHPSVRLCLGDPFFTDTMLQSAALLVPQDTSLPVSIDCMDLFPEFFDGGKSANVRVELMEQDDRDLIYKVTAVGEDGSIRAELSGYRLRILKHHDHYPTVADLIRPEERDRQMVRQALDAAGNDLAVTTPFVDLATIVGIHDQTRDRRRDLEMPLLEKALQEAADKYDVPSASLAVHWEETGKPAVANIAGGVLDLSLTHEDRTCLCSVGPGPMGCDLAAITSREKDAWIGLLGPDRARLLDELAESIEDLDTAGTRVWAATETLGKIGVVSSDTLRIVKKKGTAVLFEVTDAEGSALQILTLAIRLTWGRPQILAVTTTTAEKAAPRVPAHLLTADYPGYEPLYEVRPFEMIEGGPQGQLVFVQRLPVTFQPSANLSRTIYFSNFIKWMGNTREASAWPVLAQMSDQFASGRWGGVTNYGHLKIVGEGATSDQVEILMWVSDNSGPENSTMTLSYDFRKMGKDGGRKRLAFCRLQTTWVEILGPGKARVAPYPTYYGHFIEDMCPRFDAPDIPAPMEESMAHLLESDDDPILYLAPPGPVIRAIVREQVFDTTLAHANLVGNIYYANYYDWQGQIRDRFFYDLIPDYFGGIGEKGELLALESRVDHLREAMPFDRIKLTLAVKELRSCSVTFHVDYFRLEPDGSSVKIAYGFHRAVWVTRDGQNRPVATPFPDPVRLAFDTVIGREVGKSVMAGTSGRE